MNRLAATLLALTLLVGASSCTKVEDEARPTERKAATLIYMVADNNLDYHAVQNINAMEQGLYEHEGEGATIYVYIDRAKGKGNSLLYKILPDTSSLIRSKIEFAYPEMDSADPSVLRRILNDVGTLAAGRNERLRGLILWSHGSAWLPKGNRLSSSRGEIQGTSVRSKSFGVDSDADTEMGILGLSDALSGQHFDFLIFDACFMGSIEVAYELRSCADYIIASPTEVLASGFPYRELVPLLRVKEVDYQAICDKYLAHYQSYNGILNSASVCLVRTAGLTGFAQKLGARLDTATLERALRSSVQYEVGRSKVLFDINALVNAIEDEGERDTLRQRISEIIIHYRHTDRFLGKIPLVATGGLSIFIPNGSFDDETIEYQQYRNLSWARDSHLPRVGN